MKHFSLEIDKDGIALVTFDSPGRSMNVLSSDVITEINEWVANIAEDDNIKGAVVTSGKSAFCAGADLAEMGSNFGPLLARMKTDEQGAKRELFDIAFGLNAAFRALETCGKPVAAAINGLALGGGFELALACHARFCASDNKKLKLGFPEAMVGLLPGAGGTQRLPRMVGLMNAAPLLIQAKQIKAKEALGLGIINGAVPTDELIATAKTWVLENPKAKQPWDQDRFRFPGGDPWTPQGFPMFAGSSAMVRKESFGNYPALGNILRCVYEGSQLNIDAALRIETRYFCDLLMRPESHNMIRSLFISKQAIDKGDARPAGQKAGDIKSVGVIGAGFMGAGVAYVSAMAGIDVILIDRDQEGADKGKQLTIDEQAKRVKRKKTTQEKADAIAARITATTDYALLKDVDLIVEAVFENSELKASITKKTEAIISDTAVFGSNTSTIPISDLAKASSRPENFIGIHFFSPVHKMALVEIIKGEKTSDYAISRALDFAVKIRKTPIVVEDTRGFYANRCVMRYINEGMNMLSEGVKPELIENAAKGAGMPVGPLSLQDEVAIDLGYKILQQTKADMGNNYVAGKIDPIITAMIEKYDRMGRKNGKGFYDYNGREKSLWPELGQFAVNGLLDTQPALQEVKDRILYAQAIEAARTMAEGIVSDPREADLGSIFGWGFAPYTGGAISFIDTIGAKRFVKRADELRDLHGEQFEVPTLLREMADSGETFYKKFGKKPTAHTKSSLDKMLEKDVVALANAMGIDASVSDLKADTVAKILAAQ
ncbi:MAG: 3-hydroxyacyl-CoA dehydrogenase [Robiginitomaculum sp.]|nr:MAG: 3-hydroxyacyl-CoA dehydrogenase [Robiginitomaculum sp.]